MRTDACLGAGLPLDHWVNVAPEEQGDGETGYDYDRYYGGLLASEGISGSIGKRHGTAQWA